MPIEILVPIGIFVLGMVISHFASSAAVEIVKQGLESK
jgi:hypothetical protein